MAVATGPGKRSSLIRPAQVSGVGRGRECVEHKNRSIRGRATIGTREASKERKKQAKGNVAASRAKTWQRRQDQSRAGKVRGKKRSMGRHA